MGGPTRLDEVTRMRQTIIFTRSAGIIRISYEEFTRSCVSQPRKEHPCYVEAQSPTIAMLSTLAASNSAASRASFAPTLAQQRRTPHPLVHLPANFWGDGCLAQGHSGHFVREIWFTFRLAGGVVAALEGLLDIEKRLRLVAASLRVKA
jgi:hypothetical protein